jgi:hypothetical protein
VRLVELRSRLQDLREVTAHRCTFSEALFQQAYGCVVQTFLSCSLFYRVRILPNGPVNLINKPLESRQPGSKRNSGATEEHDTPIFVRLDQPIWDVRAIFYKLHVLDAAPLAETSVRALLEAVWSYRFPSPSRLLT